jgi:hypothetical protein
MHRSRVVTVWQALGTAAAAVLTSAALALPAAAAAGTGGPAPRAARPAATGSFPSWPQAETAAGFGLHRPTRLHSLHRDGPVSVRRCAMPGQHSKRFVTAVYGDLLAGGPLISFGQNNSGAPCSSLLHVPFLRNVRIHSATAQLFGDCGNGSGRGGCRSHGGLELIWTRGGTVYEVKSVSEPQHVLLNFARHLHQVA